MIKFNSALAAGAAGAAVSPPAGAAGAAASPPAGAALPAGAAAGGVGPHPARDTAVNAPANNSDHFFFIIVFPSFSYIFTNRYSPSRYRKVHV